MGKKTVSLVVARFYISDSFHLVIPYHEIASNFTFTRDFLNIASISFTRAKLTCALTKDFETVKIRLKS